MPYKHSQSRRHKFTNPKYKVNNWPEYNDALRRRGDFTIWFTEDAINDWRPAKTGPLGSAYSPLPETVGISREDEVRLQQGPGAVHG